jgi:hypothetical protein
VGSGTRYTFTNPGEQILDDWMAKNAFVTWVETDKPWALELALLTSERRFPLNIDANPDKEAVARLVVVRAEAKRLANELPIIADNGGSRRAEVPGPRNMRKFDRPVSTADSTVGTFRRPG